MKTFTALTLLTALAAAPALAGWPKNKDKQQATKEQPPAPGSAGYRPSVKPSPSVRPSVRPANPQPYPQEPATRPATKPGSGNGLPSQGGNGATRPYYPPSTRPLPQPEPERPEVRPIPGKPTVRPTPLPEYDRPDTRPRPDRPTTKPWPPQDDDDFLQIRPLPGEVRPTWPNRPSRPETKPSNPWGKPVAPGINRPPVTLPIHRPTRPALPPQTNNIWQNHNQTWNQWTIQNNITINNFVYQRPNYWRPVQNYWQRPDCWQHYGRPDWVEWRRSYWDYRTNRCYELWNALYWVSGQLYDMHWWNHCEWAGRPVPSGTPQWWWYQPVSWETLHRHLGSRMGEMKLRDPGVDVVYYDGTVYVGGENAGSAEKHRNYDRDLAARDWGWEPPFPGGRFDWLPLGVWALAPQEQGEATMILQLAISREGYISGAYTNAVTGEEQPISGRSDLHWQRAAWRIGNNTSTVIETGLAGFTWDVTGAFLHFGSGQSQIWLLTRMPSPGLPPGPVRLPFGRR